MGLLLVTTLGLMVVLHFETANLIPEEYVAVGHLQDLIGSES